MKRYLVVLAVAAMTFIGAQAYAHHSFAATYLEDQTVQIEGELVQFLFRNPHSFVHVMVTDRWCGMPLSGVAQASSAGRALPERRSRPATT